MYRYLKFWKLNDIPLIPITTQSSFEPLDEDTFKGIQISDEIISEGEVEFFTNFKETGLGGWGVDLVFTQADDSISISCEKENFTHIPGFDADSNEDFLASRIGKFFKIDATNM